MRCQCPGSCCFLALVVGFAGCGNPNSTNLPASNGTNTHSRFQQASSQSGQFSEPTKSQPTDSSIQTDPAKSLNERLQEARAELSSAETKLHQIESELTESLRDSNEYRIAKEEASTWDERVNEYRAARSSRLAEASKSKLAAHNKVALLERQYRDELRNNPKYAAAVDHLSRLKKLVADLAKEIKTALAKAEKEKKEREEAKQQAQMARYSSSGASTSGGGTVHVRGYTRKDGTYVKPHTRRK